MHCCLPHQKSNSCSKNNNFFFIVYLLSTHKKLSTNELDTGHIQRFEQSYFRYICMYLAERADVLVKRKK